MITNSKKIASFTGGAMQVAGLLGVYVGITERENWYADEFIVMSSSALLAIHMALKEFEISKEICLGLTEKIIFGKFRPLDNDGKITISAGFRAAFGKNSLGKQEALREKLISDYLTIDTFDKWKNGDFADINVVYVNYDYFEIVIRNLRDCEYIEAIDVIMASSAMPIFVNPTIINNNSCYDGGVLVANAGADFLDNNVDMKCIWNRDTIRLDKIKHIRDTWKAGNVISVITRTIEIMTKHTSYTNEIVIDSKSKLYNNCSVVHYHYVTPNNSFYEIDPDKLVVGYEIGLLTKHTI